MHPQEKNSEESTTSLGRPIAPSPRKEILALIGRGLLRAGRALGYGAKAAARAVASGYHAVDPDLRRHISQLPLVGLSMIAPRKSEVAAIAADGYRPVLFVHGLGGHPGNFSLMKLFFRACGRRRIYTLSFRDEESLEAVAQRLVSLLEEVARQNNLPQEERFDIVAHSMGGIVARLALELPHFATRVKTLITLGTPHSGTYTARFANTPHVLQLRPGSALVERLKAQLPWGAREGWPRLVAFYSSSDLLLLPATAACVEGAENIELGGLTHYSYLLHPACFQRVFSSLA